MPGKAVSLPTPLPAAPGLQPGRALALSACLSVALDGDRVVYFLYTKPFASHAADDKASRNLCLGRCALLGLATLAALASAFGISPRTVARARERLRQRGESGYFQPRRQRRRHGIEDPAVLARAARLLRAGHSVYSVARQLGVSASTLWRYTQEGLLPASRCAARRPASGTAEGDPGSEGSAGQPAAEAVGKPVEGAVEEAVEGAVGVLNFEIFRG